MINLNLFCSNESDSREYLRKPFEFQEDPHVYATNGYIAVRVLKSDGYHGAASSWSPLSSAGMEKIFKFDPADFSGPIKAIRPEARPCEHCKRTGFVQSNKKTECEDCNGDGKFSHGNHMYSCKNCDGEGKISSNEVESVLCDRCNGTKEAYPLEVEINGKWYLGNHLALIADLPNSEILIPLNGIKNAVFTFDGGIGVVMTRVRK